MGLKKELDQFGKKNDASLLRNIFMLLQKLGLPFCSNMEQNKQTHTTKCNETGTNRKEDSAINVFNRLKSHCFRFIFFFQIQSKTYLCLFDFCCVCLLVYALVVHAQCQVFICFIKLYCGCGCEREGGEVEFWQRIPTNLYLR